MDQFHPFPKDFFLKKGIGKSELYLGWGLTQGFVSWVAWEGEVWLIFKVGRWDFKIIPRNYFFRSVGCDGWKKVGGGGGGGGVGFFFFFFFFLSWCFYLFFL
jgi:hypothetical protein